MPSWFVKVLKSKFFFLAGLTVLIFLIVVFGREFSRRYYLEQQIKNLESEIGALEGENQEFTEMIEYFDTQNFTEEEARLKMGLRKPGEEVIVINQPEDRSKLMSDENIDLASLSNQAKWWYYFVDRDKLNVN